MSETMEAPVVEVVQGKYHGHQVFGIIRDISKISKAVLPYQLRIFSPMKDDGVTRWQTILIGHFKTLDDAVDSIRYMCL